MAGYNDLEFVVADFAIACAGLVCVPMHGTYSEQGAAAVINKVRCSAVCFMRDHANYESRMQAGGKWTVQGLRAVCPSLRHCVVMDATADEVDISPVHPNVAAAAAAVTTPPGYGVDPQPASGSFLDFVCHENVDLSVLPPPFQARGAPFVMVGEDGEPTENRVTTVLFTSGSSGTPKAVAVGVDEFVTDISFTTPDSGVTVSYIPLSHGSDRYKVGPFRSLWLAFVRSVCSFV